MKTVNGMCTSESKLKKIMGWKRSVGEIIGIFVGVSIGASLVHYAMGGRRQQPQPDPSYSQPYQ